MEKKKVVMGICFLVLGFLTWFHVSQLGVPGIATATTNPTHNINIQIQNNIGEGLSMGVIFGFLGLIMAGFGLVICGWYFFSIGIGIGHFGIVA